MKICPKCGEPMERTGQDESGIFYDCSDPGCPCFVLVKERNESSQNVR